MPAPQRSFDRGSSMQGPPSSVYRTAGGRTEYYDNLFAFNRYAVVHHYEDFEGAVMNARYVDDTVQTAGTPVVGLVADAENGEWKGTLDLTGEVQSARLTWGDQRNIPYNRPWRFEAYVKVPVALAAAQRVVIGLGSDYNASFDTMTKNFWFRLEADQDLLAEVDDGVSNQDDFDTGFDVDQGYHLYTIFSDGTGRVRFWFDRNLVATLSGIVYTDTALLQPFIAVQKDSGAGIPAVTVDFVDVWWERFA